MFTETGVKDPLLESQVFARLTPRIHAALTTLDSPSLTDILQNRDNPDNSHTDAEIKMARLFAANKQTISQFLGLNSPGNPIEIGSVQISPDNLALVFWYATLLGDCGKAGPNPDPTSELKPLCYQIYVDAVLDGPQREWLKTQKATNHHHALMVEYHPLGLHISLDQLQTFFDKADPRELPLGLAIYTCRQYALEKYPDYNQVISDHFQLRSSDLEDLHRLGLTVGSPMQEIWTKAHLLWGRELLLQSELPSDLVGCGILGLCHHLTSGIYPPEAEIFLDNPLVLKIIALLEIVDKVEAQINRSHKKTVARAIIKPKEWITDNLKRNYPNRTDLKQIYDDTFRFLEESDILSQLLS